MHRFFVMRSHSCRLRGVAWPIVLVGIFGLVASAGNDDTGARLISRPILTLKGPKDGARVVAFSPDGKMLACGGVDKSVRLWSVADGKSIALLQGRDDQITALAFSPQGDILATGSWTGSLHGKGSGVTRLWNTSTWKTTATLSASGGVVWVSFSPSGKLIATVDGSGKVSIRETRAGRLQSSLDGAARCAEFMGDEKSLVSAGNDGVSFWDLSTGKRTKKLPDLQFDYGFGPPIALTRDGKLLVTSGKSIGTVTVWNIETNERIRSWETSEWFGVDISPNGKLVVNASPGLQLWDVATGKPRRVAFYQHDDKPYYPTAAVRFSPDGKTFALGSRDSTVIVWDATKSL